MKRNYVKKGVDSARNNEGFGRGLNMHIRSQMSSMIR